MACQRVDDNHSTTTAVSCLVFEAQAWLSPLAGGIRRAQRHLAPLQYGSERTTFILGSASKQVGLGRTKKHIQERVHSQDGTGEWAASFGGGGRGQAVESSTTAKRLR